MLNKKILEGLFRQHYSEMFHLARTLLGADEEAEDIVQGDEWRQLGGHLRRVPTLCQLLQILVGLRLLLSVVCCPLSLVGTKLYLFHKTNKQIHSQLLPNDFKSGYFNWKYSQMVLKSGYFRRKYSQMILKIAISTRDRRF